MGRAGRFLPVLLFVTGAGMLLVYILQNLQGAQEPARQSVAGTEVVSSTEVVTAQDFVPSYGQRFGVTSAMNDVTSTLRLGLPFGSYADWAVDADPPRPGGVFYWQMIRLQGDEVRTPQEEIDRALAANPGATWLIGNEPDVVEQDNVPPETYAEHYHELYTYIKDRDPTAQVAIGGVSQPTPLRRAYLDVVLDTYEETYGQPMPIDVWNVHAFILREEHDSWGIGIPPGMSDELGMLYEIEDHANMDIFRRNIIDFRDWMAQRGYADRPLLVSEYGFLMPLEYGFSQEDVTNFLTATFDFFLSARNDAGYAPDDGRLVQWWLWFILSGPGDEYTDSYLYDRESGQLTDLGRVYADYVQANAP